MTSFKTAALASPFCSFSRIQSYRTDCDAEKGQVRRSSVMSPRLVELMAVGGSKSGRPLLDRSSEAAASCRRFLFLIFMFFLSCLRPQAPVETQAKFRTLKSLSSSSSSSSTKDYSSRTRSSVSSPSQLPSHPPSHILSRYGFQGSKSHHHRLVPRLYSRNPRSG